MVVGAELVPTADVSDAFKLVCVPSELPDADEEPDEPEAEELDDELESDGPLVPLPAWSLLQFPPRARRLTPRPGRHN